MKYEDERKSIKTGDILAWSEGSWKNWHDIKVNVVRMATRSEYSHVGLAWVVNGRVFVIEAVVPKIRIYPLSMLRPFYHFKMPKRLSKKAEDFMLSKIGESYSELQAIMSFLGKVKNGDDALWECAEIVNTTWGVDIPAFAYVQATPTKTIQYCMEALDIQARYIV